MSAIKAPRKRAVVPARSRSAAKGAGPKRRSSLRIRVVLLSLAIIAFLFVLAGRVGDIVASSNSPSPIQTLPFTYSALTGDTPASVASAYASNTEDIMHQTGSQSPSSLLTPGLQVIVDAGALWMRMSQGALAPNEVLVETTARRLGVEPALAIAVAWQESRLDESARSETGAMGIMQIEPDTGRLASIDLGVPIDPHNAHDNVLAGLFWLRSLLQSYGGDRASALAAYYEGPGNLARRGYLTGTVEYVRHAQQLRRALLLARPRLAT